MDTTRLKELAGVQQLNEMDYEMEEEKGKMCKCPFCGTEVACDKLPAHIKADHGDLIKYYKKMDKKDDDK